MVIETTILWIMLLGILHSLAVFDAKIKKKKVNIVLYVDKFGHHLGMETGYNVTPADFGFIQTVILTYQIQ